ncbi:50S ribosomal protein P1 [Candidatus Aciduliprofundum boonei]|uniref:Large ribosomal subunit protein P1 n=1 Tax=Aciduliprofundum boonei (strain DSM 19572 / T469) TaxID=439481 RepID=B5IAH5_ACIB4|nr:50S ribosomal protein P1 [Candidatus Aciduliprofundum boonei]ADD08669.1 ribosomal protein 60S [Aciduliprofundum boonei T469]EDY34639.1 60s Acidic ribosomal protein [Aciduliprofundum boonei T469]EDY37008.1 60s Acidic ribosomal protein [Aciduliprofundum boonei T469]HII55900.1 50S ribosomal protein P1 [Candidatus Aciduliprofundum boonei]
MEYVYSALILHSLGKEINEDAIANIIKAAGAEPDMARIKALVSALSEIDIDEAIKNAAFAPVAAAPAAAAPSEEKEEKKEEEKKEEEEEEKKEEEAIAGLGALFG